MSVHTWKLCFCVVFLCSFLVTFFPLFPCFSFRCACLTVVACRSFHRRLVALFPFSSPICFFTSSSAHCDERDFCFSSLMVMMGCTHYRFLPFLRVYFLPIPILYRSLQKEPTFSIPFAHVLAHVHSHQHHIHINTPKNRHTSFVQRLPGSFWGHMSVPGPFSDHTPRGIFLHHLYTYTHTRKFP